MHPPGTVGILSDALSRWSWFHMSMLALEMPPGTQLHWEHGNQIAHAVNNIIRAMRPEDAWLFLLADDHIFAPDLLLRMLDHQLPLVAPFVALRRPPYPPSLFHEREDGQFAVYTHAELTGKQGLLPVDTFGGPGVVIRREVLEKVGMPFFENMPGQREAPFEDLYAFSKCRHAGFQPYCDLDTVIGHCLPAAVFPHRTEEGRYGVRMWSYIDLGILYPG